MVVVQWVVLETYALLSSDRLIRKRASLAHGYVETVRESVVILPSLHAHNFFLIRPSQGFYTSSHTQMSSKSKNKALLPNTAGWLRHFL